MVFISNAQPAYECSGNPDGTANEFGNDITIGAVGKFFGIENMVFVFEGAKNITSNK